MTDSPAGLLSKEELLVYFGFTLKNLDEEKRWTIFELLSKIASIYIQSLTGKISEDTNKMMSERYSMSEKETKETLDVIEKDVSLNSFLNCFVVILF